MTHFYLGNGQKNNPKKAKRFILLNSSLILAIFLTIFLYLLEVNFISINSFKINELKKTLEDLKFNNQLISLEVSEVGSTKNLDFEIKKLNFVKAEKADYLNLPITSVAIK
jgi:hypothetical protein